MVERLSICLSHRLTTEMAVGRFAAERPAGGRYRSIAVGVHTVGAVQQGPVLSSKCGQHHVDSWQRRLDTDFLTVFFLELLLVGLGSPKQSLCDSWKTWSGFLASFMSFPLASEPHQSTVGNSWKLLCHWNRVIFVTGTVSCRRLGGSCSLLLFQ